MEYTYSSNGTVFSETQPTDAGTYTVKATCETADTIYTATKEFTISPKSISGAIVTLTKTTTEYSGTDQTVNVSEAKLPSGDVLNSSYYTVSGDTTKTNAGTYTVTITGKDNYTGIATATWTINPKSITISGATATDRGYAANSTSVEISGVTFAGATLTKDTDYTVTGTMTDANAGENKPVTVTVTLTNGNYSLETATYSTTVTINKATYSGTFSKIVDIVKGRSTEQTGTLTVNDFLATPPAGAQIKSVSGTGSMMHSVSVTNGTLSYTSNTNIAATADETYTVTISSTNYNDFTATLKFHSTDKQTQAALTISSPASVTFGQTLTLSASGGSSGGAVTYAVTAGTGTATVAGAVLTPTKAGTVTVVATMAGDDTYEAVSSAAFAITINKATPAGAPKYTPITTSGKKLSDAALTTEGGTFSVDGSVKWVDAGGNPLADTTEVTANTEYTWLFTPTDTTNYNTLSGSIILYPVSAPSYNGGSSSGGSSSASGTVTVPVSSDSGTVNVRAEVSKNGTATVEISDRQIEAVAKNGSGTVTIDVSGAKNVESVQVPAQVVETTNKAENTGLTVALPDGSVALDSTALESASQGEDITISVQQVPATDLNEQQQKAVGDMANIGLVVDVDLFVGGIKQSSFNGGTLTISIPYTPKRGEDTSKLTVWFIRDDGTIENKGGHYDAAKGCFVFETDHLSRYVLVNVSARFADVPVDAYFAGAVNWAVQNGVTGGVTETAFAPYASCTRAQIVTFLYRYAVNAGLDVSVGEDTNILSYNDAFDVPEYAIPAFQWACGAGITQGNNGDLMPNQTCTRAQIVTFLFRMLGQ